MGEQCNQSNQTRGCPYDTHSDEERLSNLLMVSINKFGIKYYKTNLPGTADQRKGCPVKGMAQNSTGLVQQGGGHG